MLQPDPRSGEGCNTLLHAGVANVNTRKRLLYRHCYIPSFLVQVFTIKKQWVLDSDFLNFSTSLTFLELVEKVQPSLALFLKYMCKFVVFLFQF